MKEIDDIAQGIAGVTKELMRDSIDWQLADQKVSGDAYNELHDYVMQLAIKKMYENSYTNMKKEKYNGWSNYATWRINLEILGDIEFDHPVTYDYLEEIVEDVVFTNKTEGGLAEDYAKAFISQVDFREIASGINAELELQT